MKCLILAAGKGSRIIAKGDSKPIIPLLGLPLIERTIVAAARAGLTDLYVVTGYNGERVAEFLANLSRRRSLSITTIMNPNWESGSGTSLLAAREWFDENFVLLMADHVFDETILSSMVRETLGDGELMLAIEYVVTDGRLHDADDVTSVLAEDGRILEITRGGEAYNACGTGIYLCSPAIFRAAEESSLAGDQSLSGAVRCLVEGRQAKAFDVQDRYWIDIDMPADLRRAETLLYDSLIKPHDGFISRTINRKFSIGFFTPLLLKLSRRITANQVSIISLAVSLIASSMFFIHSAVIGGILIQLASILDGSDGEIARLKKLESSFGNFFDAVLDRYSDSFILFGMFYYSWTAGENADLFGTYWTPIIFGTSMLALFGNAMVSYTSAKSVVDFGYRYGGTWVAAGKGRDLRLFVLFLGGVMTLLHPISVFVALLTVAVLTNTIVLRRIAISSTYSRNQNPLVGIRLKAVIFDFDGTIADTMPFLTDLAVQLMTENYEISREVARSRYRETTGMDFGSQMEEIFPNHPRNRDVVESYEARKRQGVLKRPIFPEVVPTLMLFKNRGVRQFICSSTREEIVTEYVRKIDNLVDSCFGYRPGFEKDKQIEFILRHCSLDPDQVLFVSDSLRDYDFVKDQGVRFIGIQRMFNEREFQERGLFSVQDLTALTRLWDQSEGLLQFVEKRAPAFKGR